MRALFSSQLFTSCSANSKKIRRCRVAAAFLRSSFRQRRSWRAKSTSKRKNSHQASRAASLPRSSANLRLADTGVKCASAIGGQFRREELQMMQNIGCDILCGTVGRLCHHVSATKRKHRPMTIAYFRSKMAWYVEQQQRLRQEGKKNHLG